MMVSLWVLIGLSLTFGYETRAQHSSQNQVEVVDTHIHTKTSGVSYVQLVQQAKKAGYTPLFIAFSFESLLQLQHTNTTRTLTVQEINTHTTQHTVVIDHLQQRATLSDDTDISFFPVTLS
ncbi:hypothetical protein [Dokdonia sp.]|uniref:hypothetical protein n=1 Tax=Dokdonia sp. TaxID=2024995 RepID=UPI003264B62D